MLNAYIALFRGSNVGGNNILPMRELTGPLTELGYSDVKTYIQSGNAVFRQRAATAGLTTHGRPRSRALGSPLRALPPAP